MVSFSPCSRAGVAGAGWEGVGHVCFPATEGHHRERTLPSQECEERGWPTKRQTCKSFVISMAAYFQKPASVLAVVSGNSPRGTRLLCALLSFHLLVLPSMLPVLVGAKQVGVDGGILLGHTVTPVCARRPEG